MMSTKVSRVLAALLLLVGALLWFYASQTMDSFSGVRGVNSSAKTMDPFSGVIGVNSSAKTMDSFSGVIGVNSSAKTTDSFSGVIGVNFSAKTTDSFTIIMPTYKRTDILLKLLQHYQAVPQLKHIVVVWNNIGEEPPRKTWESLGPHRVPVLFKEQTFNRVNNRMLPASEIDTEAVLMLDDDLQFSSPDVTFAFSVWKRFPDQLVGFMPRSHVTRSPGVYSYSYRIEVAGGVRYSMALTGAVFIHRQYLQLYREQPSQVIDMVDKGQNCEDITMNFIVALWLAKKDGESKARPAAIYVKASDIRYLEGATKSGYHGLWHRKNHMQQRSYCLNQLAKIYGRMPLRYSNLMLTRKHP